MADRPIDELWVCHLGTVDYREALDLQERVRTARQADEVPDVMLVLEHWPVYTRGRRSGAGELPMGEDWYRAQGIDIVDVDRGGKITYHGPGQLVGYPIVRVDDVVAYLRTLEDALAAALHQEGIADARGRPEDGPDYTGVWVGERKLASLGVHLAKGVTTHGWAVNVENDLQPFSWVVACGLPEVQMTSLIKETGRGRARCPASASAPPTRWPGRWACGSASCPARGSKPLLGPRWRSLRLQREARHRRTSTAGSGRAARRLPASQGGVLGDKGCETTHIAQNPLQTPRFRSTRFPMSAVDLRPYRGQTIRCQRNTPWCGVARTARAVALEVQ